MVVPAQLRREMTKFYQTIFINNQWFSAIFFRATKQVKQGLLLLGSMESHGSSLAVKKGEQDWLLALFVQNVDVVRLSTW